MHEQRDPAPGEYHIWRSRQVAAMEAEAQPKGRAIIGNTKGSNSANPQARSSARICRA
jgi:hypothetical protein